MPKSASVGEKISILPGVPEAARGLVWQTFFVEAERGVDFATHLPWHGESSVWTVLVCDDDHAIAAAIMRPASQTGVAMVGYVCVDVSVRGQGYARRLIASVKEVADDHGYRATLLWTGKPDVYAGQDFAIVGHDDFLRVERIVRGEAEPPVFHTAAWPGAGDAVGLPAFATTGYRLCSGRAEAIVVEGKRSVTLIDWSGDFVDVVALMDAGGHKIWGVNLSAGHDVTDALPVGRYSVQRRPGATTMAYRADPSFVLDPVPVIDRI
jgi:GNAT superfamily N-acetyltransferase